MQTHKSPGEVPGAIAAGSTDPITANTATEQVNRLLRCCFDQHTTAAQVLDWLDQLEEHDVFHPHQWAIIQATREHAAYVNAAAEAPAALNPLTVDVSLRGRADYEAAIKPTLLREVFTGDPDNPVHVPAMIDQIRQARLRRAFAAFGARLTQAAATGTYGECGQLMSQWPYMERVARRAGLVGGGERG